MRFRFWPRTLSAQLILVMLLAVALSQGVSLLVYRMERAHAVRSVVRDECLGRAVSAFRLAQATPRTLRAGVLQTVETPLTRYWLSDAPPESVTNWVDIARDHLKRPTPAAGRSTASESLFLHSPMLDQQPTSKWELLKFDAWLLKRPVHIISLGEWNGFGFALQLDDGQWLNTVYAKPDYLVRTTLTPGYYTTLVITVLIFALAALFIARRISRPLRKLAASAEKLGRGEEVELLKEEGPHDIHATIEAFNRMQIRTRRFVEDRTRMLAAIGHDLRTPITSMRLRAEFVTDADAREKIVATLDEMQAMTEAALSFARSEATSEPSRPVDLGALVESLCDDLASLGWKVEFEGSARITCTCRPDALRRAIRNIIENAVRYGERARVTLRRHSEGVDILVEDDGPGIPEGEHERVFAPFVRLESSRNSSTGGVGLGLSIARSIFRSHGGDVTLAKKSKGLCVQMHLPI